MKQSPFSITVSATRLVAAMAIVGLGAIWMYDLFSAEDRSAYSAPFHILGGVLLFAWAIGVASSSRSSVQLAIAASIAGALWTLLFGIIDLASSRGVNALLLMPSIACVLFAALNLHAERDHMKPSVDTFSPEGEFAAFYLHMGRYAVFAIGIGGVATLITWSISTGFIFAALVLYYGLLKCLVHVSSRRRNTLFVVVLAISLVAFLHIRPEFYFYYSDYREKYSRIAQRRHSDRDTAARPLSRDTGRISGDGGISLKRDDTRVPPPAWRDFDPRAFSDTRSIPEVARPYLGRRLYLRTGDNYDEYEIYHIEPYDISGLAEEFPSLPPDVFASIRDRVIVYFRSVPAVSSHRRFGATSSRRSGSSIRLADLKGNLDTGALSRLFEPRLNLTLGEIMAASMRERCRPSGSIAEAERRGVLIQALTTDTTDIAYGGDQARMTAIWLESCSNRTPQWHQAAKNVPHYHLCFATNKTSAHYSTLFPCFLIVGARQCFDRSRETDTAVFISPPFSSPPSFPLSVASTDLQRNPVFKVGSRVH